MKRNMLLAFAALLLALPFALHAADALAKQRS